MTWEFRQLSVWPVTCDLPKISASSHFSIWRHCQYCMLFWFLLTYQLQDTIWLKLLKVYSKPILQFWRLWPFPYKISAAWSVTSDPCDISVKMDVLWPVTSELIEMRQYDAIQIFKNQIWKCLDLEIFPKCKAFNRVTLRHGNNMLLVFKKFIMSKHNYHDRSLGELRIYQLFWIFDFY